MGAAGKRHDEFRRLRIVDGCRVDRGPSALWVDARGPVHRNNVLRRQELARLAIQDIKETVLGRMQQHLTSDALDFEVRQNHWRRGGVIPLIARHLLVVPQQAAGVRVDRQDRREKQIISTGWAAFRLGIQRSVAGADV